MGTSVRPGETSSIRSGLTAPTGLPFIHFGVGTAGLLDLMKDDGGSIIGVDWRTPLDVAWSRIGHDLGIQGNLDGPGECF